MDWSQMRSAAVCLLAVVTIVGFVAPVSAIDANNVTSGDGTTTDEAPTTTTNTIQTDGHVPEEVCTDITGTVQEEVPFDQVIWVDDLPEDVQDQMQPSALPGYDQLPEDAQPPGAPWTILTPRAIAGILLGAAPNQCDVADPNDPPWDPTEDNVAPDGGADVDEETEEGSTLVIVNGTLDQTSEGPSGEGSLELVPAENGSVDPALMINDGEKNYGVDSGIEYWNDGTIYGETDVTVIGLTVGGEMDCIGEECNPHLRGVPKFTDYPAIPSHSSEDPREDTDEGTGGTTDSSDPGTGTGSTDTSPDATGATDSSGSDSTRSDDNSDGSSSSSSTGSSSSSDANGGSTSAGTGDSSSGSSDGGDSGSGTDASTDSDDGGGSDSDAPAAQEQSNNETTTEGDGPGFGAGIAVLALLGGTLLARRRR